MEANPPVKQDTVRMTVLSRRKYFLCRYCPTAFSLKEDLTAHMVTHRQPPPSSYPCPKCGTSCATEQTLGVHLRTHTGENVATCATCGKGFTRVRSLNVHLRSVHTGVTAHPCSNCLTKFASAAQLKEHPRRTHLIVRPTHANQLNQQIRLVHLRVRPKPEPEHCPMCGQACNSRGDLAIHLRTHTGEKPFKCTTCSRDFARKQELKSHSRIHTGEMPYKCDSCPMAFRYSRTLRTHKARAHVEGSEEKVEPREKVPIEILTTGSEASDDPGNGLQFYVDQDFQLKELTIPILRMTIKNVGYGVQEWSSCEGDSHFVCCRCGRGHRDEGSAQGHALRCKVQVCPLCRKSFASPFTLKRHLTSVHGKTLGSLQHGCRICGQRFYYPSALRHHELRHSAPQVKS